MLNNVLKQSLSSARPSVRLLLISTFFLLLSSASLQAAPIVEVYEKDIRVSLSAYVDVLEDKKGALLFEEVSSDRYTHQFFPAPLTDLYFGYTRSVFWLRFSVENQLDKNKNFIFEVTPADIDYVDVYQIDQHKKNTVMHKKSGSAIDFDTRDYDHPYYFFDINIPANTTHTFYVRLESNKTINAELVFSSVREHFFFSGMRDWWQGFLLGALFTLAFSHLCLAYLFKAKGFAYFSAILFSMLLVQSSWNGYFIQFLETDAVLLDRQVLFSVYLSMVWGLLFARTYLHTHHRLPLSHRILTVFIILTVLGMPCAWLFDPYINAILLISISIPATFFVFGLALYSFMEGYEPAKYFLVARTITVMIILVTLFSVQGLLPRGFSNAWGIMLAFLIEGMIFLYAMVSQCVIRAKLNGQQREQPKQSGFDSSSEIPIAAFCHELRTPMSGVMGMTELMMESHLTEQQRTQLDSIKHSGSQLLEVVNKMSDLSSLERGDIELQEISFDILSVIEDCVENSRNFSERRNIELIYKVDENIAGFVRGDQDKLQQILNSLITFSLRQMDAGEVLISTSLLGGDEIQFELLAGKNTYAKEYAATIFSGEGQKSSADNLNLSLAKQLILLMGGELHIQYRPDGGSRLYFQLALPKVQGENRLDEESEHGLRDKRLLVVDDNDTCCKIVQQQATLWGMDVVIASSGKEALALMRSHANLHEAFDLILIDYDMPGMNGVELVTKIQLQKEQYLAQNTIMLILTGVSKMPSQIIQKEGGIKAVLYKPLSGKSLKRALIEAFN